MSKDDEAKIMAAVKPKLAKFKGESDALYSHLDNDKNGELSRAELGDLVPMPKPDPALAFKVNDARRKLVMESASTRTKLVGSLLLSDFFCTGLSDCCASGSVWHVRQGSGSGGCAF